MDFIVFLLSPIIHVVFTGSVLWVAAKLTSVDLGFKGAAIAVILSAMVSWIPLFGGLLSLIVFFLVLKSMTNTRIWPDLIIMVIVSKVVAFAAEFLLV